MKATYSPHLTQFPFMHPLVWCLPSEWWVGLGEVFISSKWQGNHVSSKPGMVACACYPGTQEGLEFDTSLDYSARPCLSHITKPKQWTKAMIKGLTKALVMRVYGDCRHTSHQRNILEGTAGWYQGVGTTPCDGLFPVVGWEWTLSSLRPCIP